MTGIALQVPLTALPPSAQSNLLSRIGPLQTNQPALSPQGAGTQRVPDAAIAGFNGAKVLAGRPDTGSAEFKTMAGNLRNYLNNVVKDDLDHEVIRPGYTYQPESYEDFETNIAIVSATLRQQHGQISANEFLDKACRIGMDAGFNFGIPASRDAPQFYGGD